MKSIILIIILAHPFVSLTQKDSGVLIKEKLTIEYKDGHHSMTQTRTKSDEKALFDVSQGGAVKYELSKKGKCFTVYETKDNGRWFKWKSYKITASYIDQRKGENRYNFLATDGSYFHYVPNSEEGPLVILNLFGAELVCYVFE